MFLNEQLIIKIHILYYKPTELSISPTLHKYLIPTCYHLYMTNTYVFIDSSNLFYGGKNRLSWRIDYKKFYKYLEEKYDAKKVFYYSGIETHGFEPTLDFDSLYPIEDLIEYLGSKKDILEEYRVKDINRAKFLKKISSFGYILRVKPVKHIKSYDGTIKSKANCDVDLTLDLVRLDSEFDSCVLCSGDGDFEILLRYLNSKKKEYVIIGNADNTASVYKNIYSNRFKNFEEIRQKLIMK